MTAFSERARREALTCVRHGWSWIRHYKSEIINHNHDLRRCVHAARRWRFPVFSPSHLTLMALPLVRFTVLQKSRTLPPRGHLYYENAAVDDDECFNQLAYCSEQVVEPWGTVACERQWHITWMITPAAATRTPDSALFPVEGCWVRRRRTAG